MAINLSIDTKDIDTKLNKCRIEYPKIANLAESAAINRTLTHARTLIDKEIRNIYNIKQKDVRASLTIKKSTPAFIVGELESRGVRLRLGRFNPTESKVTKRGVVKPPKVTVKKGMKKELPRNYFTFQSRATGKREVFKRENQGRYKYGYGFTISVPQMISDISGNAGVYPMIRNETEEWLQKRIEHELDYRLSKVVNNL